MADIFSTVAGVASVIDVALRGCNALYDSIHYLKDAPQLSLRLRRTVRSVESILRCLDDIAAIHRQQQASAGVSAILPDAVTHELISIRDDLDALSILLPTFSSSNQLTRRLKWVLDRKQVAEVLQRLNSHQTTLLLALQSFEQRNGISVNEQVSGRLGQIERQHEDSVKELKGRLDVISTGLACTKSLPAQEHLDARFKELHELISTGQDAVNVKLDALGVSQSQLHINHSQVQSSTVLAAPTEDVLVRMFRAEILRMVIPTVQQCFSTSKANSDNQVNEIKRIIDEMAHQLGSKLGLTLFDYTHMGFLWRFSKAEKSFLDDKSYILVIEALLQAPESAIEDFETHKNLASFIKLYIDSQRAVVHPATSTMTSPPYLQRLSELGFKVERYHSNLLLSYFMIEYIGSGVQYSSEHIAATLGMLVDLGVDLCPVDSPWGRTLLHQLFWMAESNFAGRLSCNWLEVGGFEDDWLEVNWVEVATAFLKNGADPYALDPFGDSLFDVAEMSNRTSSLLQALERAGYDVDEVQREIQWRQWCFHNPSHGFAASTAVDGAEIAQPSAKGLVLRKSNRGDRDES
ncbi:MAG: hypothetical protein Q9177_002530 [Variospora cf. flavescens]